MSFARTLLISCLGVSIAAAQPAPPPAKAKAAKQYVDAGLAAQNTGDYDTAITFYEKAYELVPHPVLLFNMAQAHRLAKRDERALELYKKYLAADPKGAQAKTASEIVAEIEAKLAATKAAEQAEAARAEEQAKKDAAAARPVEVRSAPEPARPGAEPPPSPGSPGKTLRIAGIGVGAVGVVGVGVGIVFGLKARSISDELSELHGVYSKDKEDDGKRANAFAIAGLVGGTVLVAAGVTLYWRGHVAKGRAERVAVTPMIGDQMAGFAVSGLLP